MKKTEIKLIDGFEYVKLAYKYPENLREKSAEILEEFDKRRTVRDFSDEFIPKEVIENIILAAATAPSGAHKQPWTFVAISNPAMKSQIRVAAEEEELTNYSGRMSERWLKDLLPLGTNKDKPFLEIAPWLIVVFKKIYDLEDNEKMQNYYVNESVGIASGMLIQAIHQNGLVCLTHTPSPMNFLSKLLERPANEKPFLLIPVGYPAKETFVPKLERKSIEEVSVFFN